MVLIYKMPLLTLSLTSATNVITLDHGIDAQHLRLKFYHVQFPDANYTDSAMWLEVSDGTNWLSHDVMNGVSGAIPQGKFLLPVANGTANRSHGYSPNFTISGSSHIPKVFTVKLFEADGATAITDAELTSLRLFFEYDLHEQK